MDLKSRLIDLLHGLGFELVGFARPEQPPHYLTYTKWVEQGLHAGMSYLAAERALERRAHPARILPEVRALLVAGLRYTNPNAAPEPPDDQPRGRVAAYAWGPDYHDMIPPRLAEAARQIAEWIGKPVSWRAYTDTGPLLERDFASRAGLGWIGKNTCLISPEHGSYFLLGELLMDFEFEPDKPFQADRCGSCRRCIEACPTACIRPDRIIDSARCISYLTIENKGPIPEELRSQVGDWVFGCDICQQVCPWNIRFAAPTGEPALTPDLEIARPRLLADLKLTPVEFNRKFKGRPQQRARRRGYLRNLAVALGNSRDPRAFPALAETLATEPEALVRAHAAWALARISGTAARSALEAALREETDPAVRNEIIAALG
jgi:epoxyqueuosine reductase